MASDPLNDKPLFRYLGLLSHEVVQIQKTFKTIDSQESRLRAVLDELTLEKEVLVEQMNRMETVVKQAATSAFASAELESDREQTFASEKSALQAQIKELEERLLAKEIAVEDLQVQFTAQIEHLNEQIREKDSLLQVRDVALKDLKTAADSLNRLVSGLSYSDELVPGSIDGPQDIPASETANSIKQIEERASMEIERLKIDIREKELALAAKSAEIEITKQKMTGRIEELEKALDARRRRKSQRLVSFISDMSGKRFI